MKNNIVVVYSTHLTEGENKRFEKHISDTIGVKHTIIGYENHNQYSLSELYNHAIHNHKKKDCIFVMCHNDIKFKTKKWGLILLNKYNNYDYDIIGVAGSKYVPESGRWWEKRQHMYGIVDHTDGEKVWTSEFSKEKKGEITPVVILDGLFMSFDPEMIINKFDEDFKGFHFYDLGFTFPNYLDGNNIGVTTDIRILHESVGRTNQQWELNRQ
ncbi:MAG: glycosyltransferase, partial [bacterium]